MIDRLGVVERFRQDGQRKIVHFSPA